MKKIWSAKNFDSTHVLAMSNFIYIYIYTFFFIVGV